MLIGILVGVIVGLLVCLVRTQSDVKFWRESSDFYKKTMVTYRELTEKSFERETEARDIAWELQVRLNRITKLLKGERIENN